MSWTVEDIPVLYREFHALRDKLQEMAASLKEPERDDQPWTAPAVRELMRSMLYWYTFRSSFYALAYVCALFPITITIPA